MLKRKNRKNIFILFTIFILQSCGSLLNSKGAKTKCLRLNTENMTVECNCYDKQIQRMEIITRENLKQKYSVITIDTIFNPTIKILKLPITKYSANKIYLEIELYLTNSHHRELYFIKTKPGDYTKTRNIYSRYISH
jgi:hypothetical protein